MITHKSTCPLPFPDQEQTTPILPLVWTRTEECIFFDIETTGFRASTSHVYLIGAAVYSSSGWKRIQWISEKPSEEAYLLRVFAAFLRPYRILIHFNGERFDIPYLSEKYSQYGLPNPLHSMDSLDLYQRYRPLKKLLGLAHMNQKSLENFLGICREDRYDGGTLIKVCHQFWKTHEEEALRLLILHNQEDLSGMLSVTALDRYLPLAQPQTLWPDPDQMPSEGTSNNHRAMQICARYLPSERGENAKPGQLLLTLRLNDPLPVPIRAQNDLCVLIAASDRVSLFVPVFQGRLKVYFDHYKDYYYLPLEDQAIHKSVAVFVDAQYREKATADTCYIAKEGMFLPQTEAEGFSPVYKKTRKDCHCYFAFPEDWNNAVFLEQYTQMLLKELCCVS